MKGNRKNRDYKQVPAIKVAAVAISKSIV